VELKKKHGAATLLATCCGARKGEFLDPKITFHVYSKQADKNFIGTQSEHLTLHEEDEDEELTTHLLLQKGVLKDSDQKANKYLNDEDDLAPNRIVIKPTLCFNASYIVDQIAKFQVQHYRGNIYRPCSNVQQLVSTFQATVEAILSLELCQVQTKGWSMGSHFGRKLYAVASFGVYKDSVQAASHEIVREASWASMVLARVATSLSYANVQVNFNIKPAALEMPPKELVDELYRELQFLRKQVEKLTKQKGVVVTSNKQEAGFVKEDGTIINLERHSKRKFIDEADRKATFDCRTHPTRIARDKRQLEKVRSWTRYPTRFCSQTQKACTRIAKPTR